MRTRLLTLWDYVIVSGKSLTPNYQQPYVIRPHLLLSRFARPSRVHQMDYLSGASQGCTYTNDDWECAQVGCGSLGPDYVMKHFMAYAKYSGYLPIRGLKGHEYAPDLGSSGVECCRACYK